MIVFETTQGEAKRVTVFQFLPSLSLIFAVFLRDLMVCLVWL